MCIKVPRVCGTHGKNAFIDCQIEIQPNTDWEKSMWYNAMSCHTNYLFNIILTKIPKCVVIITILDLQKLLQYITTK